MINWKLRFQNKATLTAIEGIVVACVYQLLGIFGIVAPVSENEVVQVVGIAINLLCAVGVVVDPTTAGVADSGRAMNYSEPRQHSNQ